MTALYDGWSSAAAEAAKNVTKKSISRVLLLSDGQANEGLTDQDEIASHCAQMASVGVSTTTYGLSENFNENLMSAMAKSGKGMAHYGQTADDLADPFQSEFDLINALTARDLKLHLIAEPGVEFEVMNKFQRNLDGSFVMSDLAEGGELWALLKIKVSKNNLNRATNGKLRILSAFLNYKNMEGESCRTEQSHLNLDLISDADFAALATEELVSLRKVELEAANLQDAARIAARRHDWNEVNDLVAQLDVLGVENEWVKESTKKLREYADRRETERFSKEAFYKSDRMRTRMGLRDESARYIPEAEAMEVPSFLRRKVEFGKKSQSNSRN
jgi:Ca-activated chloride channel family protein